MVATVSVVYDVLLLCYVYLRVKHGDVPAAGWVAAGNSTETSVELAASVTGGATGNSDAVDAVETVDAGADMGRLLENQAAQPADGSAESDGTGAGSVPEPPPSGTPANGAPAQLGGKRRARTRSRGRRPQRLSEELRSEVIYLKSEDHYLHLHTAEGLTLVKMRLADAVSQLGDSGLQVHRSYWAAYRHMRELTKRDRRLLLQLSGGHEVPVSARHSLAVEAALRSPART